jgi:hypothetical protein
MPGCDEVAAVRRLKGHERGRLYLHCPRCHTLRTTGEPFQEYIETHATMGEGAPAPARSDIADIPAPAPAPAPAPKPEKPAPVPGPAPAQVPKPAPAPARVDSWHFELDDL